MNSLSDSGRIDKSTGGSWLQDDVIFTDQDLAAREVVKR